MYTYYVGEDDFAEGFVGAAAEARDAQDQKTEERPHGYYKRAGKNSVELYNT